MSEEVVTVTEPDPQPGPSTENEAQSAVEAKDDGGSSPGRSSPEGNCPICLGKLENKSFTDSCFHQFCFLCLMEWSKVKAECPLCKRIFKSIIHTVRSIEDYEQYHLTRNEEEPHFFGFMLPASLPNPTWHTPTHREPFRYRTTAVNSYLDYVVRLEQAMSDHVLPSFGPTLTARTHFTRRRQNGTSDFRRNIYQQGLWVQRMTDVTGRVRDCSPEFFRANDAQSHRLVPWLNRELNVLCGSQQVQQVLEEILTLIKQVPIRSAAFSNAVSRHIGRHTEHFVHEFHSYATSPYDLVGYDRHANYVTRNALAHLFPSEDEGNDSDVQFVATTPSTLPPIHLLDSDQSSDSDDVVVVEANLTRQSSAPAEPIEVVTLDTDDDVVQVNISLNVCSENENKKPIKRRKLKRNWLTVSDLNLPSTSRDTMNVSINIGRSRTSSTSSVNSSSSSWSPHMRESRKKSKKTSKTKDKKGHKAKSSKIKFTLSNKGKSLKKYPQEEPSTAVDIERPSTSRENAELRPVKKQEPTSDEDIDVLRIETDQELSSSEESEYKPKLKSVVFKSEVKPEPKREMSPRNSLEAWPWASPRCSSSSSINSVAMTTDSDSSDLYKPSCSYKLKHQIRKHSRRDKFRPTKKPKRDRV